MDGRSIVYFILSIVFLGACRPAESDFWVDAIDTAYVKRLPQTADTFFAAAVVPDAAVLGAATAFTYAIGGGQKKLTLYYDAQDRVVLMTEKRYQLTVDSVAFHPNGQRLFQLQLNSKGLADGSARFFYADGRTRSDGRYANGIKTGIWREFKPNGRLQETHEFDRYGHKIR
jgi:hypothetical protein